MDGRFNPFALRDEEWLIVGFKMKHPNLGFRELAYTMIDEDIAYVSPSTVYAVLRRHGLVTTRKEKIFLSKERYRPIRPDEIWQCDIMYVKVKGRFFYLIVFIDVFSRYIRHHALLRSMDADSAGLEAQKAIETLRKDSLAEPVIQTNNGSSFIGYEFKIVLRQNGLTQKRIHPHTPEQNGIVERANRTLRDMIDSSVVTNYQDACNCPAGIVQFYNNDRRHSSLQYLTPAQYYRGNPDELLKTRKIKMEMARMTRKERNMKERKGGEVAGASHN